MKSVAGRLKLDLAQFRDVEAFAQFGSELDAATQRQLSRGQRMVATLNQPQYAPWPVEEQVVVIWAATNGFLDEIPVEQVPRFNGELVTYLRGEGEVLRTIRESRALDDSPIEALRKAVEEFSQGFEVREAQSLVGSSAA